MSATERRLKLRWIKSYTRMTKLLENICLENFYPCVFGSNQCYAVGTVLRKYKGNTEYSAKVHVQQCVKLIFMLCGSS